MIVFAAGARPNFVKVQPLIDKCREKGLDYLVFNSNQHQDNMQVFKMGEIKEQPKINRASRFSKTVDAFTHFLLNSFDSHFIKWIVVVGDTDTSLACALVADMLRYKVAHVEAGLRSFYKMPEETNRIAIDSLSTLNFAPTGSALENLTNEHLTGIHVGNIMIESLLKYGDIEKKKVDPYILIEIHRQENDDNMPMLLSMALNLSMPVKWIKHPRHSYPNGVPNIEFLEPQEYKAMTSLVSNARLVITDSGGLQCETFYLDVPCITVRKNTEWYETVIFGNNHIITEPENILKSYKDIMFGKYGSFNCKSELWDDQVSERILEHLK